MAASRAPKSPEKAMAIILFSILALVIVLMSLTSSADLRVHEGHLTHRDPRTFAMHRKERLGRRNSVDDVEGDVRVSKRRHDDDDGGDIDDDEDDDDDDRKERGSRASSSSIALETRGGSFRSPPFQDPRGAGRPGRLVGAPRMGGHRARRRRVRGGVRGVRRGHGARLRTERKDEFIWRRGSSFANQRCEAKEATALERDRRFEHRGRVVRGGTTTREGGASGRRGEW